MLGVALQDVCLLVFMARMDWDKEAEKVGITKAQLIFVWSYGLSLTTKKQILYS